MVEVSRLHEVMEEMQEVCSIAESAPYTCTIYRDLLDALIRKRSKRPKNGLSRPKNDIRQPSKRRPKQLRNLNIWCLLHAMRSTSERSRH